MTAGPSGWGHWADDRSPPRGTRAAYRGPMRILHLSDTHLYADPSARHYDRIDTTAALQGLLARFAALPPIDAIVHTGDASEDRSEERRVGKERRSRGAESDGE